MTKYLLPAVLFFCSSITSYFLSTMRHDSVSQPQIIISMFGILVVMIVIFIRFPKYMGVHGIINTTLFYIATLMQVLIIGTGGFKSPFIILLYLFSIAIGVLMDTFVVFVFLVCSVGVLLFTYYRLPSSYADLMSDPATMFLYGTSFVAIIPLIFLLSKFYHMKDKILQALSREMFVTKQQEKSILTSLPELIIIINRKLSIVSVNDTVLRTLFVSESALVNQQFFDMLILKDQNGLILNAQSLNIDLIFTDKSTIEVQNLELFTRSSILPFRQVDIKIKPAFDLNGEVLEAIVIITDTRMIGGDINPHARLDQAKLRYQALVEGLRKELVERKLTDLKIRFDQISDFENDLLAVMEIEDHAFERNFIPADLAQLSKTCFASQESLANILNTPMHFSIINFDTQDVQQLVPKNFPLPQEELTSVFFTTRIDVRWFELLMKKLVQLGILLSSSNENPSVSVTIENKNNETIIIRLICAVNPVIFEKKDTLFMEYYNDLLPVTNLKFGSGLEGFLTKVITEKILNIPIYVLWEQSHMVFEIRVKKYASSVPHSLHTT